MAYTVTVSPGRWEVRLSRTMGEDKLNLPAQCGIDTVIRGADGIATTIRARANQAEATVTRS